MDASQTVDIFREAINVSIKLSAPILLLCLVVGVVVAILQAVTQIHEQSVGFVLKMIVVISVMMMGGGWMLETLQEFSLKLFDLMARG